MKKIVVFTTSDIQTCYREKNSTFLFEMYGEKWYSTGKFEKAISEKYEIYVISSRSQLGMHDIWWVEQIPKANIIIGGYDGRGATDKKFIETWREFYRMMGYNPDEIQLFPLTVLQENDMKFWGEYKETWMSYWHSLHRIGIATAKDILV